MAALRRTRACSREVCLRTVAAMVWWPPPPRLSITTWTFTWPMLRAEILTMLPACTATKLACTPSMLSRSLAAWGTATWASAGSSPLRTMAQPLYIWALATRLALALYSGRLTSKRAQARSVSAP